MLYIRIKVYTVKTETTRIFFAIERQKKYSQQMAKKKFTTTLDEVLIKELKKLGIDLGRSANDLIEEGIRLILDKYEKRSSQD